MFPRLAGIAIAALILAACTPAGEPVMPTLMPTATIAPDSRATEPNETAAPTSLATPTFNAIVGYLTGHVTIGPLQPVQRAGPSATPAPEVFSARSINIFQPDGTTLVVNVRIDSDGTFRVALPPGVYVVTLAKSGLDRARGLPKTVTIEGGKTVTLDVDIDTGIR
jgi:hypothetical protein